MFLAEKSYYRKNNGLEVGDKKLGKKYHSDNHWKKKAQNKEKIEIEVSSKDW